MHESLLKKGVEGEVSGMPKAIETGRNKEDVCDVCGKEKEGVVVFFSNSLIIIITPQVAQA